MTEADSTVAVWYIYSMHPTTSNGTLRTDAVGFFSNLLNERRGQPQVERPSVVAFRLWPFSSCANIRLWTGSHALT